MTASDDNSEIDLKVLLLILCRHFKLLVIVTVLVTLLGSLWALTRPPQYRYQQIIQLMHYYVAGKLQVIQPTVEIKQLVENIYLPNFQQQYNQQHPNQTVTLPAGKSGNYNITYGLDNKSDVGNEDNGILYISAHGGNNFKKIFVAANHYIFTQIVQEQRRRSAEQLKNIQTQINILSEQLPELEKLQTAKNDYLINKQNGNGKRSDKMDVANILHDIYISSTSVQQNQDEIIMLKIKLADLQHQIASITSVKLNKATQAVQPSQVSPIMKIILSFLVGLFLAVFTIFFIHIKFRF